jgi:hypothetical protein
LASKIVTRRRLCRQKPGRKLSKLTPQPPNQWTTI